MYSLAAERLHPRPWLRTGGGGGTNNFWPRSFHAMLIGSVMVSAKISHSRGHGTARSTVPPPMTTSQADSTVCCFPDSPPEISENILVICVVALGGGAQSPLHIFSRDALLTESDGDQGPTATAGRWSRRRRIEMCVLCRECSKF